jgi:copper chaperone CopZ
VKVRQRTEIRWTSEDHAMAKAQSRLDAACIRGSDGPDFFTHTLENFTMQTMHFDVHGMTCAGCTASVQRSLRQLQGVSNVKVTLLPGTATVQADSARIPSPAESGGRNAAR